jgi:hypothetical protein
MEQLEFKFVTDEKRKRFQEALAYAEIHLQLAKDHKEFGFADVAYRQRVVDRIKSEISKLQ